MKQSTKLIGIILNTIRLRIINKLKLYVYEENYFTLHFIVYFIYDND